MRIERVVAGSFTEASEQTKERFGRDAILLATHQVGELTELLVGVDEVALDTRKKLPDFDSLLREEIRVPAAAPPVTPTAARVTTPAAARATTPAVAQAVTTAAAVVPAAAEDGEALVRTIRRELQALERRLAVAGKVVRAVPEQVFALLEQGVSASYAQGLLERASDSRGMAAQLLADLQPQTVAIRCEGRPVVLIGPPGAGKTTLAVQLAHSLASAGGAVGSLRDRRPGARERFFALADAARLDARWGQAGEVAQVLDGSAMETESEIAESGVALWGAEREVLLCLSATVSRSAAVRWLKETHPAGVLISHWDPMQLPLGLLALLAEQAVPLCGVSSSADPEASVELPAQDELERDLGHLIQLSLHDIPSLTE